MKVVSLGSACQVRFNIDRLFKKQETVFFDWLITDFKSVLYVLKNINDKELVTKPKFTDKEVYISGKSWVESHHKVEAIDFKFISIHDFPSDIDYMDYMDEFILKYNRRLNRLKTIINSDENVHMIHCMDHQFLEGYMITNEDICDFKKYLYDINPNNKCFLHIAIAPKYGNIDFNNLIQDNVYIYYLKDTQEGDSNWTNTNFNWNIVFDNINNIS